jgi:hypothetical protein
MSWLINIRNYNFTHTLACQCLVEVLRISRFKHMPAFKISENWIEKVHRLNSSTVGTNLLRSCLFLTTSWNSEVASSKLLDYITGYTFFLLMTQPVAFTLAFWYWTGDLVSVWSLENELWRSSQCKKLITKWAQNAHFFFSFFEKGNAPTVVSVDTRQLITCV